MRACVTLTIIGRIFVKRHEDFFFATRSSLRTTCAGIIDDIGDGPFYDPATFGDSSAIL